MAKRRSKTARTAGASAIDPEIAQVEARYGELIELGKARDEQFSRAAAGRGEARKPLVRLSQLQRLWLKEEISSRQLQAGRHYADLLERLQPRSPRSCLNHSFGGAGEFPAEAYARDQRQREAIWRALGHEVRSINLLFSVLGADCSLHQLARGDSKQRRVLHARLCAALEVLADVYRVAG